MLAPTTLNDDKEAVRNASQGSSKPNGNYRRPGNFRQEKFSAVTFNNEMFPSTYKWSKFIWSSGHSAENIARRKCNRRNISPPKNFRSTVRHIHTRNRGRGVICTCTHTKTNSEFFLAISTKKICTFQNFPLHGTTQICTVDDYVMGQVVT